MRTTGAVMLRLAFTAPAWSQMGAAMQLYAGFALLVIAILVIIVLAALVSNLVGSVRRRFGRTRAHDDFSAPAPPSRRIGERLYLRASIWREKYLRSRGGNGQT